MQVCALLILLTLGWASPAKAIPACFGLFSRVGGLERKLAGAIPDYGEYFKTPTKIELGELQQSYWQTKGILESMHVRFLSPSATAARRGHVPSINSEIEEGSVKAPQCSPEWLFEIRGVQASGKSADALPTASLFTHPQTQRLLDRLSAIGVPVYADPTTALVNYGGQFSNEGNYISLPPTARYLDLVHEGAHAEFAHYRIPDFIRSVSKESLRPRRLKDLLKNPKYRGYGRERLLRVVELVRQGFPENAINERMSVEAELGELRQAGFAEDRVEFTSPVGYARWHVLNDLAGLAEERPLSEVEKRTFLRAVFENLLASGQGSLQKQYRYGRKLAQLLGNARPPGEPAPDFGDVRLEVYRRKEARRSFLLTAGKAIAGTALAGLGMTLAFNPTAGQFVVNLGNGTIIHGSLPPDDDRKKKRSAQ